MSPLYLVLVPGSGFESLNGFAVQAMLQKELVARLTKELLNCGSEPSKDSQLGDDDSCSPGNDWLFAPNETCV